MKDYCTLSPDVVNGVYIGDCCKLHDNLSGEKGTYSLVTPAKEFYKCLSKKDIPETVRLLYVTCGTFGVILKYPYLAYKKFKWRRNNAR